MELGEREASARRACPGEFPEDRRAFLGRRPTKESHKLLLGTEGDRFDERIMGGTLLRVVGRSPGRAITGKSDHRFRIEDGNLIEDEDG